MASARRFCQKLYNSGEFQKTSHLRFENFTNGFFDKDKEFYQWKLINNARITDNTLLRYNELLKYQLLPFFANYQLSKITKADVKNWIIWASDKWSAKTVNNAQTVLNNILNQAVDKDIIPYNPALNLSFRKVEKKNRELLTVDEVRQVYRSTLWSNETYRKAFLLDCVTGLRISELVALQPSDIKNNCLNIRHSYSRQFGLGDTKTKEKRYVPYPVGFEFPESECDYIFAYNGKPFDIVRFLDVLHIIWRDLGIDYKERGLTTHTIRNFFISYLQSENITESKIRAIAGHKDSSMTGLYTYWTSDMFQDVIKAQEKLYLQIINEVDYGKKTDL